MSNELITWSYQGLDIVIENNEPWLTQAQMVKLLGITQVAVSRAVKRAIERDGLDPEIVTAQMLYTASDGKTYTVNYYSMDVFLIVGYRADTTPQVSAFRKWVAETMKRDYMQRIAQLESENESLEATVLDEQKESRDAKFWEWRTHEEARFLAAEMRGNSPIDNWDK